LDSEEDDASSESVEDVTTPTLVSEALKASFSLEQIKQAEAKLDSPSSLTSKVCSELKQGAISRRIVDIWIENHKGKVKPWAGPLPSPRRSPLHTFGDVLAKAKVAERSNEFKRGSGMGGRQMRGSPVQSSVRPRQRPMPAVTMVSTSTRFDRATLHDQALIKGNSKLLNGLTELGCHVINMGHKSESVCQSYGYRPTLGLISLFNKT
jgi:hypothetical protein